MGFIIDAFMATGLLAWWFARHPLGKYSWKMFVLLSMLGDLGSLCRSFIISTDVQSAQHSIDKYLFFDRFSVEEYSKR